MPRYRRVFVAGGTYFFTAVTYKRQPLFARPLARSCLRRAIGETRQRRPFEVVALCLLPDHLHTVWTLPDGDDDFPRRWGQVKGLFSRYYLADNARAKARPTQSAARRGRKPIWQPRYWEHLIRDENGLRRHVEYIHYNPVKHGLVARAADWEWSTFLRYVRDGVYPKDWGECPDTSLAELATAHE